MSDKFQFVFQGGGAKLGVLLAAAEAAYAQRTANNFTITRISGTSAGAIAACVLATGENPANGLCTSDRCF
jgi:predicted acylesterase/phospholipase RssA